MEKRQRPDRKTSTRDDEANVERLTGRGVSIKASFFYFLKPALMLTQTKVMEEGKNRKGLSKWNGIGFVIAAAAAAEALAK